ncbi:MAG TPA: DUF4389 domain-containing protein [Dehalococcoidia bacterium]|nr:DUF4389 domain-containing protein [Dehalococcoidia bacterium]
MQAQDQYPVRFSVDYPERELDRVSSAFRIFAVIPIAIVLAAVSGGEYARFGNGQAGEGGVVAAGGILFFAPLLMILFRQKYPRWWFDWNLELSRFSSRVGAYVLLMDDKYPSTDEEQSVHLEIPYPDVANDLNRWLPLVKWLLAIPHYIALFFLLVALVVVAVIAWFAVLFTGRYPRGLFDFAEGVLRWANRVTAYAFILATDRYPPFRLSP